VRKNEMTMGGHEGDIESTTRKEEGREERDRTKAMAG
jgi:hypothetical protein